MEPFRPAVPVARTNKSLREMAQYHKISLKELKRQLNELDKEVNLFINDVYQVDVRRSILSRVGLKSSGCRSNDAIALQSVKNGFATSRQSRTC
jgi:hypothetical protein